MSQYEISIEPRDARGDSIRKRRAMIVFALLGTSFFAGIVLGYAWRMLQMGGHL